MVMYLHRSAPVLRLDDRGAAANFYPSFVFAPKPHFEQVGILVFSSSRRFFYNVKSLEDHVKAKDRGALLRAPGHDNKQHNTACVVFCNYPR
jgi:hypothetical protein